MHRAHARERDRHRGAAAIDSKSALISNDWVVGFNGTATLAAWAFMPELYHESSHLGDEYEVGISLGDRPRAARRSAWR